jgi:hypothetical protein
MVFTLYKLHVELAPLAPGHAPNASDHQIAILNAALTTVKKVAHVEGAEMIARVLSKLTDRHRTPRRLFKARTHIFFRKVVPDNVKIPTVGFGSILWHDLGDRGVRRLLYFDFCVPDASGKDTHPMGLH